MSKTLSIATYCSNAISMEFYLKELIESVWEIADEIIVINCDKSEYDFESEVINLVSKNFPSKYSEGDYDDKIKVFHLPWQWKMGKNMGRIARSVAISQAGCDFVLLLDADEVINEADHYKIKQCIELGHDVYSFRTLHYFRDFNHVKSGKNKSDPGNEWYNYRPKLFRSGLGIFDMHDINGNYSGLLSVDGIDCQTIAKKTSIEIHHFGHVRSKEVYIKKTNDIERSYHKEWKDIEVEDFEWDMSGTKIFEGTYPESMKERIEEHKKMNRSYYENI